MLHAFDLLVIQKRISDLGPKMSGAEGSSSPTSILRAKPYDFLLKFLLVGDSDVGKEEFLCGLDNGSSESPYFGFSNGLRQLILFRGI